MKRFACLLLLLTIFGCDVPDRRVAQKSEAFELLSAKINEGDLEWVTSNSASVMSLMIPNAKPKRSYQKEQEESDGWDRKQDVYDNFNAVYSLRRNAVISYIHLYFETQEALVKRSIIESLSHYPRWQSDATGTLKPDFYNDYDDVGLAKQVEILQALGDLKLPLRKYDLKDREFVKDEICRAVSEEKIGYTALLISVADFDVGVLRCEETPRGFGWGEYVAYTSAYCPYSLRRVSGENAASAISARVRSFRGNLAKHDFQGMENLSEIRNAFIDSTRTGISLDGVESMNDLLDKFNKWGPGTCTTNDLYQGEGAIPEGF